MPVINGFNEQAANLFMRDGLYYARVVNAFSDEPLVVTLHGVVSEDQARAALGILNGPVSSRKPHGTENRGASADHVCAETAGIECSTV